MPNIDEIKMSGTNLPITFFLRTLTSEQKSIATEAVFECLKRHWPVNLTGIGYLAREIRRKYLANFIM